MRRIVTTLLKVRILQQQHPFLLILIVFEIIQESMKINNLKSNVFSLQRYLTKNILKELERIENLKKQFFNCRQAVEKSQTEFESEFKNFIGNVARAVEKLF